MRGLPSLNLSPRGKKIAKWVGYPVLAIVSFVLALQLTFPYDRVKQRIVDGLAAKYDVQIGSVGRGIMPGTVIFEKVVLTPRPKKADDPPQPPLVFDKVRAHLGLFALLGGKASVDYDVRIGQGSLNGNVTASKTRTSVTLSIEKLSAEDMPGIADLVGLPVGGHIEGTATFELPGGDWRQAELTLKLSCTSGCTIGDGKTKIYPKPKPGQPQLDGVTVARLFLTSWTMEFVIAKGKGDLKKLDVKSDDGELYVDLHVALQRGLTDSTVTAGCIKYKGSDSLQKREEKFYNALNLTMAPLGPDGYHYVKLDGTLANMRKLPQLCDLNGGSGGGGSMSSGGVEASGHIPNRPPTIRTDGVEAPPRPGMQQQPPSLGQITVPPPTPTPATPGDAGVPEPQPTAPAVRAIEPQNLGTAENPAPGTTPSAGTPGTPGGQVPPPAPPPPGTPGAPNPSAPPPPSPGVDNAGPQGSGSANPPPMVPNPP